MHTLLYRTNALVTFAGTILVALCFLVSFTDFFHVANPPIELKIARVEWLAGKDQPNDEAFVALDLQADLRSLFTWNTKQLFVFVAAEYESAENRFNAISLWDRIIERKEDALLQLPPYLRQKYRLLDQGHNLRGRAVNLTLNWNLMPVTGGLLMGRRVIQGAVLPGEYTPPSEPSLLNVPPAVGGGNAGGGGALGGGPGGPGAPGGGMGQAAGRPPPPPPAAHTGL